MLPTLFRSLVWTTTGLAVAATVVAANAHSRRLEIATSQSAPSVQPASASDDNPQVPPGLVRWHPSFADAQAAAKRSGKPVLLFHMMGHLDRQFC